MSRIGKQPVTVPPGVKIDLKGNQIKVEGKGGCLEFAFHPKLKVEHDQSGGVIRVDRPNNERQMRALHGLTQRLISNMVTGVTTGFEKRLEIVGVGYQARLQGKDLELQIGFCHPVRMKVPEGLVIEVPDPTHIVVRGADKQRVGQLAANIRRIVPRNLTRAREFATRGSRFGARPAKRLRVVVNLFVASRRGSWRNFFPVLSDTVVNPQKANQALRRRRRLRVRK